MPYDKDGKFVSMNDALDAWEPFGIALLMETAKKYNGFVTYKQLADAVQGQSGIRHDGLLTNWIGSLLGRVIGHCVREQVPQLSALCVKVLRVVLDDDDGVIGFGDDPDVRTAPLGVVGGAVVGVLTGLSPR